MAKSDKPRDLMGYDALQQDAMRGVVRAALKRAATRGLPGDHHFYITFRTDAPGARLPDELLQRFPEEMTIVLQHQFWDLSVVDNHFAVTLQFGGQPKSLTVPYAALTRFWDPSVQFLIALAPSPVADAPLAVASSTEPLAKSDGPKIVSLDQFRKK